MPKGISEKIVFKIRRKVEEEDRKNLADYVARMKKSKENKGLGFYLKEIEKNDDLAAIVEIVIIDNNDKIMAESKGFKNG